MNKEQIIDISIALSDQLTTWPEGYGLKVSSLAKIGDNSEANVSRLDFDVHCGTHIDAPLHFIPNEKSTNEIRLDRLVGTCFVAEIPYELSVIRAENLKKIKLPNNTKRLLLKTSNSKNNLWDDKEFFKDYCALSLDASQWIVDNGIDLVGIDYCSIQKFDDPVQTHQILLKNEVIILEGLDLRHVTQGEYKLTCLPISIIGLEGAPARAILQKI